MKNQALFSSIDKSKKLKYRLLQFSFGALRVKNHYMHKRRILISLRMRTLIRVFAFYDIHKL